jgi:hypothetical protein
MKKLLRYLAACVSALIKFELARNSAWAVEAHPVI